MDAVRAGPAVPVHVQGGSDHYDLAPVARWPHRTPGTLALDAGALGGGQGGIPFHDRRIRVRQRVVELVALGILDFRSEGEDFAEAGIGVTAGYTPRYAFAPEETGAGGNLTFTPVESGKTEWIDAKGSVK